MPGTNLGGANVREADLSGMKGFSAETLEDEAYSLSGATMPDGSIHP